MQDLTVIIKRPVTLEELRGIVEIMECQQKTCFKNSKMKCYMDVDTSFEVETDNDGNVKIY